MKKISRLIPLLSDFTGIERVIRHRKNTYENDAEHSFQLAILCWSANHQYSLSLSDEKILKYALIHDLVEVYAGDTDAQGDPELIKTKKHREALALRKLHRNYPEFPEILTLIDMYETKQDLEAFLVYMIDKFLPIANSYHAQDDYFFIKNISYEKWKSWLDTKLPTDTIPPELKEIYETSLTHVQDVYSKALSKE